MVPMQSDQVALEQESKRVLREAKDLLPIYSKAALVHRAPEALQQINALRTIEQELERFRLNKNEIRVYLFLARLGPHKAQAIAEALGVHRTEAYKILNRLEEQGFVCRILERPLRFSAYPLERVLENQIEERRQRVHQMERRKKELLEIWESLPQPRGTQQDREVFQVLDGRKHIAARIMEMVKAAKEIEVALSDDNLIWLYNTPFLDEIQVRTSGGSLRTRILTNYSATSLYVLEQMELGESDFAYTERKTPGFIVSDRDEAIIMLTGESTRAKALYTNYKVLVEDYRELFQKMWALASR